MSRWRSLGVASFVVTLAVVGAGCVDLTPPWNNVSGRDAASNLTSEGGSLPGFVDGATTEGEVAAADVEPGVGDGVANGDTDLAVVGDSGEAMDGPAPDLALARDGQDSLRALDAGGVADVPKDVPLGGAGGSTLDARKDVASGGQGGGGGTRTGTGGAGGISSGNGGAGGGNGSGGAAGAGAGGSGIGGAGTGGAGGALSIDAGSGRCTPSQGLVAYYPCEQATGASLPDLSGHNNNATLVTGTGGAGYSLGAGKVGQALYLSAAQKGHATLPAGILASACEATVATWVFLNKSVLWQRIFDFGKTDTNGASTYYMYMAAEDDSSTKGIYFAISTTGLGPKEQSMVGPALSTATWYHVAVVLGPVGGVLYLNGVQVGANPAMTLRPIDLSNPPNFFVGRSQWKVDPYFDGNFDEFRVYDRALTPEEIQALASGT